MADFPLTHGVVSKVENKLTQCKRPKKRILSIASIEESNVGFTFVQVHSKWRLEGADQAGPPSHKPWLVAPLNPANAKCASQNRLRFLFTYLYIAELILLRNSARGIITRIHSPSRQPAETPNTCRGIRRGARAGPSWRNLLFPASR